MELLFRMSPGDAAGYPAASSTSGGGAGVVFREGAGGCGGDGRMLGPWSFWSRLTS